MPYVTFANPLSSLWAGVLGMVPRDYAVGEVVEVTEAVQNKLIEIGYVVVSVTPPPPSNRYLTESQTLAAVQDAITAGFITTGYDGGTL